MAIPPRLVNRLAEICGRQNILVEPDELLVYECDAYPLDRSLPGAVVFPASTEMASRILQLLNQENTPFVPRGAGTSLAGGCLTPGDAVCVVTSRMNRILEVDLENECVTVEAGVVTSHITEAVRRFGYEYKPDPSSQSTCTIGGNVATNAGGPHTLKYGVTGNHVLGLVVVLPDGDVLSLGGKKQYHQGFDLKSVFIGSEGTLGLITEITVRLERECPGVRTVLAIFDTLSDASRAVSGIMAGGIIPAALEMIDQAVIGVIDDAFHYGLPRDAEAILIIELDGIEAGLDHALEQVIRICQSNRARSLQNASTQKQRALLWKARKSAFGALGRAAPTCLTQDGVVPPSQIPHIMTFIRDIARRYDLRVANNFHAGDGNIHPNFLFDREDPAHVQRVLQASREILAECVRLGGSISGEHGIGIEKKQSLNLMYNNMDLQAQLDLRRVFDTRLLANPNKVFELERSSLEQVAE